MSYYHLPTDTVRNPGRVERKLSDGAWLSPPDGVWTSELAALCGFVPVVDVPRPVDTPTTTFDRSVELVNGTPTVLWTERAKTASELASDADAANGSQVRAAVEAAIDANKTYLAIGTPTNAQIAAQVRSLTRQAIGLERMTLGKFDAVE